MLFICGSNNLQWHCLPSINPSQNFFSVITLMPLASADGSENHLQKSSSWLKIYKWPVPSNQGMRQKRDGFQQDLLSKVCKVLCQIVSHPQQFRSEILTQSERLTMFTMEVRQVVALSCDVTIACFSEFIDIFCLQDVLLS